MRPARLAVVSSRSVQVRGDAREGKSLQRHMSGLKAPVYGTGEKELAIAVGDRTMLTLPLS